VKEQKRNETKKNKGSQRTAARTSASAKARKDYSPLLSDAAARAFGRFVPPILMLLGGVLAVLFLQHAASVNSSNGFPLDDSWIHLTFARTLAATGHFAYGVGAPATSGSTSPLFTVAESLLFLFTSDGYVVGYALGILGLGGLIYFAFRVGQDRSTIEGVIPGVLFALVLALNPRLISFSVSGMETTFTIALLLWAASAYLDRKFVTLGILAGLLVWTRPDTLVFLLALGLDHAYNEYLAKAPIVKKQKETETASIERTSISYGKPLAIFGVIAVGYFIFNFALSGSLLPNTFSAKLAYYKNGNPKYLRDLWEFISQKGLIVVFVFYAIDLVVMLVSLMRRRSVRLLFAHLFVLGLAAAYWWKLPYLYQDGRYLIPILPFYILLGLSGAQKVFERLTRAPFSRSRGAQFGFVLVVLVVCVMELASFATTRDEYTDRTGYIQKLQVATAVWCDKNLPKDAVIATHDIGAFGFFSGRRIVDIVGLIDPKIIPNIGLSGPTIEFMRERHVTHVAFLANWFEVPNENPLFANTPENGERMYVYPFNEHTQLTSPTVLSIHKFIESAISARQVEGVEAAVQEALKLEPENARTHLLAGYMYEEKRQLGPAELEFRKSISEFPNSLPALGSLGELLLAKKDTAGAIEFLSKANAQDTSDMRTRTILQRLKARK
jgi:hypothetical protein